MNVCTHCDDTPSIVYAFPPFNVTDIVNQGEMTILTTDSTKIGHIAFATIGTAVTQPPALSFTSALHLSF